MDVKVELYPHVGKEKSYIGGKEIVTDVHFNQCTVHANGKMVGIYCGKKDEPNKYLSLIVPLKPAIQQHIADEVAKITGGVGTMQSVPPDDDDVPGDDAE